MVILGASGHAKDILHILQNREICNSIKFFDNYNKANYELYHFPIIKNLSDLKDEFKRNNDFIIGVGNPALRKKLYELGIQSGGNCISVVADSAVIGQYETRLGEGLNIMHQVMISNSVEIGRACLLNANCSIHHDVTLGEFVEVGPKCFLGGHVKVGNYSFIGAGAVILPGINIGDHVIIGAGSVVTKDVPTGKKIKGIPAK